MRKGVNPYKINKKVDLSYTHQVVVPVCLPNEKSYFKDGIKILEICLESLFRTTHNKTFITIVNNGSSDKVVKYLNKLFLENKINELIHTDEIGKINSLVKAVKGHDFLLRTIADSDVLFLNGWQSETIKVFNNFKKVGVVGIIPQFKLFKSLSQVLIFDNLFSNRLKFTKVKDIEAMKKFYKSLEWNDDYQRHLLERILTVESKSSYRAIVGSGHVVATYRKDVVEHFPSNFCNNKLGGKDIYKYFDKPVVNIGGWRLTTEKNYAYHMGNSFSNWMLETLDSVKDEAKIKDGQINTFRPLKKNYFISNIKILFVKLLFRVKLFYRYLLIKKGLEKTYLKDY